MPRLAGATLADPTLAACSWDEASVLSSKSLHATQAAGGPPRQGTHSVSTAGVAVDELWQIAHQSHGYQRKVNAFILAALVLTIAAPTANAAPVLRRPNPVSPTPVSQIPSRVEAASAPDRPRRVRRARNSNSLRVASQDATGGAADDSAGVPAFQGTAAPRAARRAAPMASTNRPITSFTSAFSSLALSRNIADHTMVAGPTGSTAAPAALDAATAAANTIAAAQAAFTQETGLGGDGGHGKDDDKELWCMTCSGTSCTGSGPSDIASVSTAASQSDVVTKTMSPLPVSPVQLTTASRAAADTALRALAFGRQHGNSITPSHRGTGTAGAVGAGAGIERWCMTCNGTVCTFTVVESALGTNDTAAASTNDATAAVPTAAADLSAGTRTADVAAATTEPFSGTTTTATTPQLDVALPPTTRAQSIPHVLAAAKSMIEKLWGKVRDLEGELAGAHKCSAVHVRGKRASARSPGRKSKPCWASGACA